MKPGDTVIFKSSGTDANSFPRRSGQRVTIVRALSLSEADLQEVGAMYEVRFTDGVTMDAFEDELEE